MTSQPDHLVVSAPTLDAGVRWVEERLNVTIPRIGGEHKGKGTHNIVLSLGPELYLEIIALNPDATERIPPRWTWLDDRPADSPPNLETWAVRCDDVRAALAASSIKPGNVESMSRGDLKWLITIAPDGKLARDGAFPFFIQWSKNPPHPVASVLPDLGVRLKRLEIRRKDAADIGESLRAIGLDDDRIVLHPDEAPKLVAVFATPRGERELHSQV